MAKKKLKKKYKKTETGFEKLAQVTTNSLNKVYTDFKIKEKKELKIKEEQVKKEQEKIISKDRELRKKEEEIKLKDETQKLRDKEIKKSLRLVFQGEESI